MRRPSAASSCSAAARPATAADVLELRVNGVFVMDTLETTSEIELAAQALDLVDDPTRGPGRRARPRLHPPAGARRRPGRAGGGRRDRGAAHRLDARRHRARTDPRSSPTPARRSSTPTSRWPSPRRGRRTTWCCSTSTTARATSSTRPTSRSTRPSSSAGATTCCSPGGVLVVWSANAAPGPARRDARGLRRRRGAGPRRAAAGPAGAVLPLPRARGPSAHGSAQERLEHRSGGLRAGDAGADEHRDGQVAAGGDHPGVGRQRAGRVGLAVLGGAGLGARPRRARRAGTVPTRCPPRLASGRAGWRPRHRSAALGIAACSTWWSGRSIGSTARPAATDAATVAIANGLASTVPCPIRSAAAPVSVSGGGTWPK